MWGPARMHRRRRHLNATHLSTMSRTQTPPSALTPAIPRRIHSLASVAAQLTLIGMADGPPGRFRGSPPLGLYNPRLGAIAAVWRRASTP
jgi:hypothetical protein